MSGFAAVRWLTPDNYRHVPWKNGGGVSTTIASLREEGSGADDRSGVIWQLGRTSIAVPAPFSDLSGFERMQVVVGGRGLVLETPDGEIDLRLPFQPRRYDGGTPIVSRLEAGPVQVVNLIACRDRCTIALEAPAEGESCSLRPGQHIAYAPAGAARVRLGSDMIEIKADHAMLFEGGGDLVHSAGHLILASIALR